MTGSRLRALVALSALACTGAAWLAAHQSGARPTEPGAALTVIVGVSLLGSGLGAWRARPENRTGSIMVLTGFAWLSGQLSEAASAPLYTVGLLLQYTFIAGYVWLLLAFPSGRLRRRGDRMLVTITLLVSIVPVLAAMLVGNQAGLHCPTCPPNVLQVVADNGLALHLLDLQRVIAAVLIPTVVIVIARRWLRASGPERQAVNPVVVAGTLTMLALAATVVDDLLGSPLQSAPATVFFYIAATLPVAILIVFLQRQLARTMVAGLVVELGRANAGADLRSALARALGDPSVQLAYWDEATTRYVAADGQPFESPEGRPGRSATFVEREGRPIAVVAHDPALDENRALVASVCAAAALAIDNERLHAELRARLVELRASRARLVHSTDAERRRIERDLHDGTQQRLVSIALSLGLLESQLNGSPDEAYALVRRTRDDLTVALRELRELTHGINPPVLVERGLATALRELCQRAPVAAELRSTLDVRLAPEVETAAYFVVNEALANAAKHARAARVGVTVGRADGRLTVVVRDDGIGGADPVAGSGLRGLGDRVEALGGRLRLDSPSGRGTTLEVELPCA